MLSAGIIQSKVNNVVNRLRLKGKKTPLFPGTYEGNSGHGLLRNQPFGFFFTLDKLLLVSPVFTLYIFESFSTALH